VDEKINFSHDRNRTAFPQLSSTSLVTISTEVSRLVTISTELSRLVTISTELSRLPHHKYMYTYAKKVKRLFLVLNVL
jgi:hypothetical protein